MKYIFVEYGDDREEKANVQIVINRDDLVKKLATSMFMDDLNEEQWGEIHCIADCLLENGHFNFEGDPPLGLIRVDDSVNLT